MKGELFTINLSNIVNDTKLTFSRNQRLGEVLSLEDEDRSQCFQSKTSFHLYKIKKLEMGLEVKTVLEGSFGNKEKYLERNIYVC